MSNSHLYPNATQAFTNTDSTTSTAGTPASEHLSYPQNPDSLFLIAFAARSPFQADPRSSSTRTSLSSIESNETGDLRYSLFGSDLDDTLGESSQPILPVWPEELQYTEEPYGPPFESRAPQNLFLGHTPEASKHSFKSVEATPGVPRHGKTWMKKAASKVLPARKAV